MSDDEEELDGEETFQLPRSITSMLENSRSVEDLRENKSFRETSGIAGKSISANFKDYASRDLWSYRLGVHASHFDTRFMNKS